MYILTLPVSTPSLYTYVVLSDMFKACLSQVCIHMYLIVPVLPVPQAAQPLLEALADTASPLDLPSSTSVHIRRVGILESSVLSVVARNSHRVTIVQCTLSLCAVVVFVDLCMVSHLNAVVVDVVRLERTVKRECWLSFAVEVLWVVFLDLMSASHFTMCIRGSVLDQPTACSRAHRYHPHASSPRPPRTGRSFQTCPALPVARSQCHPEACVLQGHP